MCVKPPPHGRPCPRCGQRDTLTFFPSGWVRSVLPHPCPEPIPGPPRPPYVFYECNRQEADLDYPRDLHAKREQRNPEH